MQNHIPVKRIHADLFNNSMKKITRCSQINESKLINYHTLFKTCSKDIFLLFTFFYTLALHAFHIIRECYSIKVLHVAMLVLRCDVLNQFKVQTKICIWKCIIVVREKILFLWEGNFSRWSGYFQSVGTSACSWNKGGARCAFHKFNGWMQDKTKNRFFCCSSSKLQYIPETNSSPSTTYKTVSEQNG